MDTPQNNGVLGYRELSAEDKEVMNALSKWEASWNKVVDSLRASGDEFDQRCVAIAATHVETGMMYARRSVARPVRLVEGVNA
jgi:hypothetical protein